MCILFTCSCFYWPVYLQRESGSEGWRGRGNALDEWGDEGRETRDENIKRNCFKLKKSEKGAAVPVRSQ